MKLIADQIQTLFAFTEKKFVHWYDLQVELVDHLAERIEEETENDTSLSFEKALDKVYKGFGIFGFSEIVRQKNEALRKESNRMLRKEFLHQFYWPNIIRSAALLGFLLTLVFIIDLKIIAGISIVVLLIDIIFFRKFKLFRQQMKGKKKLLLLQNLPSLSWGSYIWQQILIIRFAEVFTENNFSDNYKILFAILLFSGIIIYRASKNISENIFLKAKTLYPEAFA